MKYTGFYITAIVKKPRLINENILKTTFKKIITQNGIKILKTSICKYPQEGLSIIFFIGASHVMIHTWLEYNLVIIEIFLCGKNPLNIWRQIKEALKLEARQIDKVIYNIENGPP